MLRVTWNRPLNRSKLFLFLNDKFRIFLPCLPKVGDIRFEPSLKIWGFLSCKDNNYNWLIELVAETALPSWSIATTWEVPGRAIHFRTEGKVMDCHGQERVRSSPGNNTAMAGPRLGQARQSTLQSHLNQQYNLFAEFNKRFTVWSYSCWFVVHSVRRQHRLWNKQLFSGGAFISPKQTQFCPLCICEFLHFN